MAVVINDFEVVPAEQPQAGANSRPAQGEGGDGSPKPPDEHEIQRLIVRQHTRQERVRAH